MGLSVIKVKAKLRLLPLDLADLDWQLYPTLVITGIGQREGQQSLPTSVITPEQCRGARAMLGIKREDLASTAKVAHATLADFETGKRIPYQRTLEAIRSALETAGVQFISENGGGPGVRLRKE